jgi:hypothetical protein
MLLQPSNMGLSSLLLRMRQFMLSHSCTGEKMPKKDKELYDVMRARGYMTTEEFVEKLVPGLRSHLANNWGWCGKDELHHPEDLASAASVYVDSVFNVIGTFGVQPHEKED